MMDANIIELPLNLHHNIAVRGKYCLTDMVLNQKDYDLKLRFLPTSSARLIILIMMHMGHSLRMKV